jgi:hypothetical protein
MIAAGAMSITRRDSAIRGFFGCKGRAVDYG